tara:strand:+ start:83 stop:748 length:666 start_codon:yes stop_codon:yes gene_type:complete
MTETKEMKGVVFEEPFPHLVVYNLYDETELELIWEELNFYTKPGKLLEAKDFGGIVEKTNSHAIILDQLYRDYDTPDPRINGTPNFRPISNILTVNRKLFNTEILDIFAGIHDCLCLANKSNFDTTKIRYYHNGEYYIPHTDKSFQFLSFSYFYREPKKFSGGELYFPKYDCEFHCDNNSMIIIPGWVEHGVREVKIEDSDYYDGCGRYCISNFFGNKPNE